MWWSTNFNQNSDSSTCCSGKCYAIHLEQILYLSTCVLEWYVLESEKSCFWILAFPQTNCANAGKYFTPVGLTLHIWKLSTVLWRWRQPQVKRGSSRHSQHWRRRSCCRCPCYDDDNGDNHQKSCSNTLSHFRMLSVTSGNNKKLCVGTALPSNQLAPLRKQTCYFT